MQLRGRVAVVTGAAAGTGRVIARRLAAEGAHVVVADIDAGGAQETARAVETQGGRAWSVDADMTSGDDVRRVIAFAEDQAGGLDVLVNNAGGGGHIEPHFPDAEPGQWRATLELNLGGPMLATQLALEPMRRGGGGVVVNIASTAGIGFGPHASPEYAASKAGLTRFTTSLADLRERMNVRVNCIVPDWIATERALGELARMTPAERVAAPTPRPPEEIAAAVVDLIHHDDYAGKVIVMWPDERPRLLDSQLRV